MGITIALAGNPNSGKTTLFNRLTGAKQYVGNWPGVTVEKKTGKYKGNKETNITDLPGIYSLSPYTLEEVVSRNYLVNEKPDAIIDVVDGSNIERNLYLATQLSELGIPLIIALNMMDVVKKNGDTIKTSEIEKRLGCKVVEISALKGKGVEDLMAVAEKEAASKKAVKEIKSFNSEIEEIIVEIENSVASLKDNPARRWCAIKLFERDPKIGDILKITDSEQNKVNNIIAAAEEKYGDDGEGIITDARYEYVTSVVKDTVKKGRSGLTTSDKIDKVVTNRWLALPIFAALTFLIYYFVAEVVNGKIGEIWADGLWGETIPGAVGDMLANAGAAPWLSSLIGDGIIGGVGAVIGFLPVIAALFLCIAILEDIGYMARVAFILDRLFRRFGLSGKSFIPILIGCGCSVSGITGTRTIENDNDRRMTIICASFMPCSAKMDYIAMFTVIFTGVWWYGPIWYFIGIFAVVISGIMLKKTDAFHGDPAPFVMELPEYHAPSASNVLKSTWERCKAFIVKAGTIIFVSTVVIWFLTNISVTGSFYDFEEGADASILAWIGRKLAFIFKPLGFGNWVASVAAILGLVAKEELVAVLEICGGGIEATDVMSVFGTQTAIIAFMIFNQLTIPCFAALGAAEEELGSRKWFRGMVLYLLLFSYTFTLVYYQLATFIHTGAFTAGTAAGFIILAIYLYFIFRPYKPKEGIEKATKTSVEAAADRM